MAKTLYSILNQTEYCSAQVCTNIVSLLFYLSRQLKAEVK